MGQQEKELMSVILKRKLMEIKKALELVSSKKEKELIIKNLASVRRDIALLNAS